METEQLLNTLNKWQSKQLLIQKEEMGDLDEILLTLEEVRLDSRPEDADGYMEGETLQLRGDNGQVLEGQMATTLPYETHDIPLEGLRNVKVTGENLLFDTSRGHYRITFNQK